MIENDIGYTEYILYRVYTTLCIQKNRSYKSPFSKEKGQKLEEEKSF